MQVRIDTGRRYAHLPEMVTIIEVAKAAGVSTATVSRVLSKPGRVAAPTRERVLEVVDRLGYAPNVAARSLRTLRVSKLLVTVPDISNPFFAHIIRGAEAAARDAGYAVVVGDTCHDPALEALYGDMLGRREVDGLIFLGHRLPERLQDQVDRLGAAAPIVNGCEYSPDLRVPSVHIDNAAAAAEAFEHLAQLGHDRIGIITGPLASPLSRDRLAGVMNAAQRRGVAGHVPIRHGDHSAASGLEEAAPLIACGVTAIFCFSDEMALGALAAIRQAGMSCPHDMSVIGFDDIPMARFFSPALTTVAQPKFAIGHRCVDLLLDILAGVPAASRNVTMAHELIVRDTTQARANA